jgi:hypothetical protein
MPKKINYDNDDDDSNENETIEESAGNDDEDMIKEIEFGMTEDKIDEWVGKLKSLKEDRGTIILPIDEKIQLKLNYEDELDMQ